MRYLVLSELAFVICALAGCGSSPPTADKILTAQVGKLCAVQFRRGDALGSGADLPVSPTTGEINGAAVSTHGVLRKVTSGWIVLESGAKDYFIPRESVLLIEFTR